jgi:hypothetical protein
MSDSELVLVTGVTPHQQVNQLCRRLETQGRLHRIKDSGGRIINVLTDGSGPVTQFTQPTTSPRPDPAPRPVLFAPQKAAGGEAFVLPCSARKRLGGRRECPGASVLDLLPGSAAEQLRQSRRSVSSIAHLDESLLLPAWQRYEGTLYQSAGRSIDEAIAAKRTVVIISGGYGLVLAQEPIGHYDLRFSSTNWPAGLLAECLAEVVSAVEATSVVAFCARTTSYAQLVREVPWKNKGVDARLVTADMAGRGGAQVLVPRAAGQAFRAAVSDELTSPWFSSDGVSVLIERL